MTPLQEEPSDGATHSPFAQTWQAGTMPHVCPFLEERRQRCRQGWRFSLQAAERRDRGRRPLETFLACRARHGRASLLLPDGIPVRSHGAIMAASSAGCI